MPIPDNAVKELLSRGFLHLVAAQAGFIANRPEDYGVDFELRQVDEVDDGDGDRRSYRTSGFGIDIQLKATTARYAPIRGGQIVYDLPVKNYNDIVRRQNHRHTIPLVLALFVLPDDPTQWLSCVATGLTVRRCGYFWRSEPGTMLSKSKKTQRISVPLAQRISSDNFGKLVDEYLA